MLNPNDFRSIDQSTPERDRKLFNQTEYDKGFGDAMADAFAGTVKENIYHFATAIAPLTKMGLISEAPSSWGPNVPSSELNKKYGTDIFKDDMPEYQAQMLHMMRENKNRDLNRSSLYDGNLFLGQNAPQWIGGFGGAAISNPINLMPYGAAFSRFGSVGQGIISNIAGATLDWSFRKSIEERSGDEVTAAQLITDVVAGTALGAVIDVGLNKATGRKAFAVEKSPEEMFDLKFQEEMKAPRVEGQKWIDQAHADYIQRRANVVDAVIESHVKEGIPVNIPAIGRAIDPYPSKVDVVEFKDGNGKTVRTLVPRDLEEFKASDWGMGKMELGEEVVYRVAGDEYPTLEKANAIAKATNSEVEIVTKDGASTKLNPIDVEKQLKAQKDALFHQKVTLPDDVAIQVDGIDFNDLGKAAVFAKASNSKVTITEPDGTSWKIDPPDEFIPERPLSETQGTKPQFGDPEAISSIKAIVDDPDHRTLINKQDVDLFNEFDPESVKLNELGELEKDIGFLKEGIEAEVKAQGDKAPSDMITHLEELNAIDKTAEVEDNVFKAITSCILRSL